LHIMEGFLPIEWSVAWYAFSMPFIAYGAWRVKKIIEEDPSNKALIAVAGAFIFVLSALKIPSVTGSCSHPTGTGIAVVLFGPAITAFLSAIALLYQALLLAHGGITTLGANTASMGIIGPFAGWIVYRFAKKHLSVVSATFIAAVVADWVTYVVTSIQLALAFPADVGFSGILSSAAVFMSIFAVTQVPIALIEGVVAATLMKHLLQIKPEIKSVEVFA